MSISRRGLIAAGLAIAVVGAVGVASTLNAGAAQIAEPTSAATSAATTDKVDARKGLLAPPPGLPGGGKAAKGASAVQTEGGAAEDAAPLKVDPVYAPKGLPGFTAPKVKSGGKQIKVPALRTDGTASAAGVSAKAAATLAEPKQTYYHSQAAQLGENTGAFGFLSINRPYVQDGDLHSLAEIAVRSRDGQSAVEVGWTIDPDVNKKSAEPHLFVYHWANGQPGCYNSCGWTQYSATKKPGMSLVEDLGTTKRFTIQHFGTSWWIGYDNDWIGYFQDSVWEGKFTKADGAQWFGEVLLTIDKSCTDMGTIEPLDSEKAASFSRLAFYNGPAVKVVTEATNRDLYSIALDDTIKGFRYGGTGAC